MTALAETIRAAQYRHGHDLRLAAADLGTAASTVKRWVDGTTIPEPRHVERLSVYLEIPKSAVGALMEAAERQPRWDALQARLDTLEVLQRELHASLRALAREVRRGD